MINTENAGTQGSNFEYSCHVGTKFTDTDLSHRLFDGEYFRGVVLDSVILRGASFRCAQLIDVNFDGIDLCGSNFDHCHISNCSFRGANLRSASFRVSAIHDSIFSGANLMGACFYGASTLRSTFEGVKVNSFTRGLPPDAMTNQRKMVDFYRYVLESYGPGAAFPMFKEGKFLTLPTVRKAWGAVKDAYHNGHSGCDCENRERIFQSLYLDGWRPWPS